MVWIWWSCCSGGTQVGEAPGLLELLEQQRHGTKLIRQQQQQRQIPKCERCSAFLLSNQPSDITESNETMETVLSKKRGEREWMRTPESIQNGRNERNVGRMLSAEAKTNSTLFNWTKAECLRILKGEDTNQSCLSICEGKKNEEL